MFSYKLNCYDKLVEAKKYRIDILYLMVFLFVYDNLSADVY